MKAHIAIQLLASLVLSVFAMSAHAQTPTEIWQKFVIGNWEQVSKDSETGELVTTTITFGSDGGYQTRIRSSLSGEIKAPASGRFTVTEGDATGFICLVEPKLQDPDGDPKSAIQKQRITAKGSDVLVATDGSVIRRIK